MKKPSSKMPVVTSEGDVFTFRGEVATLTIDAGKYAKNFETAADEVQRATMAFVMWCMKKLPIEAKKKYRASAGAIEQKIADKESSLHGRLREFQTEMLEAAKTPDLKVIRGGQ